MALHQVSGFAVIFTTVFLNVAAASSSSFPSSFPPPPTLASLGVEVSARPPAFCDVVKESRPFTDSQGNEVEIDGNGWPTANGKLVVFDLRPAFAWAPPIDDPEKKIPVEEILTAIKNSSDTSYIKTLEIGEIASVWGLKLAAYEAGPGMKVGDTTNIGNRIEAQRDKGIKQIVVDDVLKNWFGLPRPGDIYNYFALAGTYSRYGCWGSTDDLSDLMTPKYEAILEITKAMKKRRDN